MGLKLYYKQKLFYHLRYTTILLLGFLTYLGIGQYTSSLQYRYEALKPSVVKVNNLQYNINALDIIKTGSLLVPASLGTGTFIDKHYVLTASHVVENAHGLNIEIDKKIYWASLVYNSTIRDYAILYIPEYEGTVVELGDSDKLKVGDAVLILGNPLGLLYTLGYGFISAPEGDPMGETLPYIQSWTQANPGNSGGGLFNDDNALVGVVVRHANNNFDFSVPINDIKDNVLKFIKEHKKGIAIQK